MKAVIIAAGMGNRLWAKTDQVPKTLLPYGEGTILSTILGNLSHAGLRDVVLVLGFNRQYIIDYLKQNPVDHCNIEFVMNDEWERGNGLSVYLAREATAGQPFLLSMSDHIVPSGALRRVMQEKQDKNLLLVDAKVDAIFDIDDATKVKMAEDRIADIGKEIAEYDHIDCGIFRLNERFFNAMERALKQGQESISAAINQLILDDDMRGVFLAEDENWIDIDTPESYQFALKNS